eukprot:CAMPEP_0169061980 /NCGR_PEP_ID=MMETSP1015-20121227/429_1 /TAXON_ID=342587 /ORGANISM="Karlodinium micrum, Strain CCMP2283" /LENGTH=103 /DNA_ID=CAMNT_0009120063 /DNA_START=52 /DNA_END=363 /DNA_ORIENTATION=-
MGAKESRPGMSSSKLAAFEASYGQSSFGSTPSGSRGYVPGAKMPDAPKNEELFGVVIPKGSPSVKYAPSTGQHCSLAYVPGVKQQQGSVETGVFRIPENAVVA